MWEGGRTGGAEFRRAEVDVELGGAKKGEKAGFDDAFDERRAKDDAKERRKLEGEADVEGLSEALRERVGLPPSVFVLGTVRRPAFTGTGAVGVETWVVVVRGAGVGSGPTLLSDLVGSHSVSTAATTSHNTIFR